LKELDELAPVLRVLMNAKLDVLAERLVELLEVVLVLRNLEDHVHALLDDVLPNGLQDFVLLWQGLTRNAERKFLGVDNACNKIRH